MKKQRLILFGSLPILFFFSFSAITHAGCPLDVKDTYIIDHLECSGDCEDLLIRNRNYSKTVYYQDDCVYCDNLKIFINEPYEVLNMTAYADFRGDFASTSIKRNGREVLGSSMGLKEDYWKDDYEIRFRDRVFLIQFSPNPNAESGYIESVKCSGNCENVKVLEIIGERGKEEEDLRRKLTRYSSCPETNLCSAITIYNHPSCGGGYHLGLAFTGLDEQGNPKERISADTPWISPEELEKGPLNIETGFGDTRLKFQLVNDPEERQRRVNKEEAVQVENQVTFPSQNKGIIIVVALFGLIAVVYKLTQKKRK